MDQSNNYMWELLTARDTPAILAAIKARLCTDHLVEFEKQILYLEKELEHHGYTFSTDPGMRFLCVFSLTAKESGITDLYDDGCETNNCQFLIEKVLLSLKNTTVLKFKEEEIRMFKWMLDHNVYAHPIMRHQTKRKFAEV